MDIDDILTIAAWAVTAVMLVLFIPRDRIREAALVYLFKLLLTWLLGLTVVQLGLIEYPHRLFAKATNTSFSFEFFIYPSICAIFNLHYPGGKNKTVQFLYCALFCSVITAAEVVVEKYSDILRCIHWTWYMTWLSLYLTFFLSRQFYVWFFKIDRKRSLSTPALIHKIINLFGSGGRT